MSDSLDTIETTLGLLSSSYGHLFYVPGNHELWTRKKEREIYDSLGKLEKIKQLCITLGVHTAPRKVLNAIWIVPLWSWYHASWDKEPDVPNSIPITRVMMDFHACSWTSPPAAAAHLDAAQGDSIARYFDAMNNTEEYVQAFKQIEQDRNQHTDDKKKEIGVVSFSHFLPFQALLPEKRLLHYPNLAKAAGSEYLGIRVSKQLKPHVHVFGHTHFSQDEYFECSSGGGGGGAGTGDTPSNLVRCVQWPLGYPRDQARRRDGGKGWGPLCVWDSEVEGGVTEVRSTYWSEYYRRHERQPHITDRAPWAMG